MRILVIRGMLPIAMALGIGAPTFELLALTAAPQVAAQSRGRPRSSVVLRESSVVMKLRRSGDRVDVVIDGLAADARVVSRGSSSTKWSGQVRSTTALYLRRPQEVGLPEAGLRSIRLSSSGQGGLELVVLAVQGATLSEPQTRVDGKSLIISFASLPTQVTALTRGQLDLSRPGRVAQPRFVPPLRSRATAPPLGDMAVGSMLVSPQNFINIPGPPVSLVLKDAPAKDALMSLARIGGFSFVYVNPRVQTKKKLEDGREESEQVDKNPLVTAVFKNEPFNRALKSILASAGFQAKLEGRTLLVGEYLDFSNFGPQMSKVFRLNQATPDTAAGYLASLGARMSKVIQSETTTGQAAASGTSDLSNQVSQTTTIKSEVETIEASEGPLTGLVGTIDPRLKTVTVSGEPRLVALAENYLKQLDLRKRQVAVKVQILNVALDNERTLDSSFSARVGDSYFVSESGRAHINFGKNKPGGSQQGSGNYDGTGYLEPGVYGQPDGLVLRRDFVEPLVQDQRRSGSGDYVDKFDRNGQPKLIPSTDPRLAGTLVEQYDSKGRPIYVKDSQRYKQPDNTFYSYLEAQVESGSAKILAEPTLLISDGEKSAITIGLEVVTETGRDCEIKEKKDAGLKLFVDVNRIDDNGFVTMDLNPAYNQPVLSGNCGGIQFFNIDKREMVANNLRLRDGQTLIISGVISETQDEETIKWPLLGDLPLLGGLFRNSRSTREKEELVIVVTPYIIDDDEGGVFGYGYQPNTQEVRRVLGQQ